MSQTVEAEGEHFTPQEAAETIERASRFDAPLRRRTEGVTWMIWGLVPAGIQLSYDAVSSYVEHGWPGWVDPVILLGWPLLGLLLTYAVWKIAVLDRPSLHRYRWRSLVGALLWLPVVYAAMGATFFLTGIGWHGAFLPLVGIGATWLVLGATNAFKATETGQRALIVSGAVILVAAVAIYGLVDITSDRGEDITQLAAILIGGGVPFVAGLWQSLTG